MSSKIIILCVSLNFPIQLFAQVERQAIQSISRGKWDKAYHQLNKSLHKDTLSVSSSYAWATYFYSTSNPNYAIDSANQYIRKAIDLYAGLSLRQRDKLSRFPIDSMLLNNLRQSIDSVAFERARQLHTSVSYQQFLDHYPGGLNFLTAVELRNEAAYQETVLANTHQAYHDYINAYPASSRLAEATATYERLLFQSYVSDNKLVSYERFIRDHPGTKYQQEAERNIFEIVTADGTIDAYIKFLSRTSSSFRSRAQNILFHLMSDNYERFPEDSWTDSLQTVRTSAEKFIVPFLHNNRFGFMDATGNIVIPAESPEIKEDYLCGNISDNVIMLADKVVALNGAVVYGRPVEKLEDIGHGFLLVSDSVCHRVVHKSGFSFGVECIQQASLLNGNFLALKRDEKWSVFTLTGRMLVSFEWDAISTINNLYALEKNNQLHVFTSKDLVAMAEGDSVRSTLAIVDEIAGWNGGRIWARQGEHQFMVSSQLDTLVKVRGEDVKQASFGAIVTGLADSYTVNSLGESSSRFQKIVVDDWRTIVKIDEGWKIFDPGSRRFQSAAYDSIALSGPFAVATRNDSTRIFFGGRSQLALKRLTETQYVPGPDSSSFLLVAQGKHKSLYSYHGKKMFEVSCDRIQYAGSGYFRVYHSGKIGLMTMDGKVIVPITMDAIGSINGSTISILKHSKFGLFNCKNRKLIPPQYAKNLTPYNDRLITIFKNGLYGLVGWDNKPVTKIEFEEIRYWNDSAAFARSKTSWRIYEIHSGKVLLDQIKDYRFILDRGEEKLVIVQADHQFGVLHNNKGFIIPLKFSDIINVGSSDQPLYFTEKHIEEAGVFVVIYYDFKGQMLRKEVYEQEDYERIYCSNN